jgi:DNA-binding NarL/FixJ family response regulator
MNGEPTRVIIADDHPVYREGLARLLGDIGGFDVVGLAADGREAVTLALSARPDVVVMDLRMPALDGVEATRQITTHDRGIGVVVLTMFDDDELLDAAVRAGARGYLLKDDDDDQIARVIHGIARGEAIFGPRTAHRLLDLIASNTARTPLASRSFPNLTTREVGVLELMARGRSNTEIATELYLSQRTVRNYVSNILSKLHSLNRSQAIAAARDAGLGQPPK